LYLLLVVCIAYVPFVFYAASLPNDDIDVALPVKYFAGECFQNGYLPLWNPYQIWGFPAHADLQYTNWNLETLLAGILYGYDYRLLHVLFIAYLFLAALGAFLLFKHLSGKARTGFYLACVYVLSGLFTAHTQSLVTILGLVGLPWVLWAFFRWIEKPAISTAVVLCLTSYLLATHGYQAFVFMILPLFACLFLRRLYTTYRLPDKSLFRKLVFTGGIGLFALLVLSAPVIVSQLQAKPFVGRLNGMSVQEVMMNPFSPLSALSFFNPALTLGHDDWFQTELTMRNAFMGLIPLMLLFFSLFKRGKNQVELLLLAFALVYLLASLGDVIPVRAALYYLLPGFKLFRFPSLLRVVALLFLLCYWALNFDWSLRFLQERKPMRHFALLSLSIASLAAGLICFAKAGHLSFFQPSGLGFHQRILNAGSWEIAGYISLAQSILLFVLFLLWRRTADFSSMFRKVVFLSIAELTLVVWLYGQFTAFGTPAPTTLQTSFSNMQKGFPFPSLDATSDVGYKFGYLQPFWKNTGAFKKQLVNNDAWTSFYFANYNTLNDRYPALRDSLLSYPFVYFSRPGLAEIPARLPVDTAGNFIQRTFHARTAAAKMQYTVFSPEKIGLTVKTQTPVILNLQQSWYSGWEVKVDGIAQPVLFNAGLLMSVAVPEGLHSVTFTYQNPGFRRVLAVSYTMLVLLCSVLIIQSGMVRRHKRVAVLLFLAGVTGLTARFYGRSPRDGEVRNGFTYDFSASTRYYDFNTKSEIAACLQSVNRVQPRNIRYNWHNYYNSPELLFALGVDPGNFRAELQQLNGQLAAKRNAQTTVLHHILFDSTYRPQTFIDTTAAQGFALRLNGNENPYSVPVTLQVNPNGRSDVYGYVTLKAGRFSDAHVVCQVRHADGTEVLQYFPLNKYLVYSDEWEKIPYGFELGVLQPGDTLALFLMNAKPAPVYVKNMTVEVFP